jgi:hypothetical protein
VAGVVVGIELDGAPDCVSIYADFGNDSRSEQVALFGGEAAVDVSFDHLALLLVGLSKSPWAFVFLVT